MDLADEFQIISQRVMRRSRSIVGRGLSNRDARLKDILNSYLPLDGTSEYAYVFALCFGGTTGGRFSRIESMAAAINLLQASTFIIDDVLDESTTRYHEATLWSEHGTGMAVACGHLMESMALEAMISEAKGRFPSQTEFVLETINRIVKDVYRGQIMDVTLSKSTSVARSDYERMVRFTTGNFFRYIARLGGRLGGRMESEIRALEQFAYCYGMALQITDDIVDFEASQIATGKDFAVDLHNKRPRLPMIVALKMADKHDRNTLHGYVCSDDHKLDVQAVAGILRKCGAVRKCIDYARDYVKRGRIALKGLPRTRTRERAEEFFDELLKTQLLE